MALDTASGPDDVECPSQAGPSTSQVPAVFAEVDLLIERPDLGDGCYTVVAKGSRIPPHLARLPSTPYRPSATPGEPRNRRKS